MGVGDAVHVEVHGLEEAGVDDTRLRALAPDCGLRELVLGDLARHVGAHEDGGLDAEAVADNVADKDEPLVVKVDALTRARVRDGVCAARG